MYSSIHQENNSGRVQALPVWDEVDQTVLTGMQYHSPFVCTKFQQRSDLGDCLISTFGPHVVCKVRSFRTFWQPRPGKDAQNRKQEEICSKQEELRRQYLNERIAAIGNRVQADRYGMTVRAYVESQGKVYDEELDEPRMVVKVPGLNAYLEFVGTLEPQKDIDWDGEHGVYAILKSMGEWAQNIWDREHRRAMQSRHTDWQPLPEWQEDYDPLLRPWMPRKAGLGLDYVDPSRRPEMSHSFAPKEDNQNAGMDAMLKREVQRQAATGIAPMRE